MGEHGDSGEGEDEESPPAPANGSPAANDPDDESTSGTDDGSASETDDQSAAETDGDDASADAPADEGAEAASEDDAAGTAPEDEGTDGPSDEETTETESDEEDPEPPDRNQEPDLTASLPSAEEWLEKHGGDEAPGMDMDAGDGVVDEAGDAADETDQADGGDSPEEGQVGDPLPEDALENRKTLAEQGYEPEAGAGGDDRAGENAGAGDGTDENAAAGDGTDEGDEDGISLDATDEKALARDARERAQESIDDDAAQAGDEDGGGDDETAKAGTPVSMSDPGKNEPAGMGTPTPAGGGGGTSTGGGGATSAFPDFDEDMAPDDQEQPLTEHIEEMTHRFLVVVLVMGLVASVALLWSDDMINFLWYSFLGPADGTCPGPQCPLQWRPHVYHPLSLVLARLKVAALVGFVAGLPVAVYQTYRFMRPGLYPHERRYYLAAVPTSLVLAVGGVGFAYFVVLPSLFIYFSAYSSQAAELAFALSDTFDLMVMMMGFFALIFQIPLLVMLAIMMGVTTRRWLESRRIYFWTGFGGVAFIFSPDPTGMAPLLVAVTMIALFEGTLLLLRWTERSVALFSAKSLEANRPYAWVVAGLVGYVVSGLPVPEGYYDLLPSVVTETLANYGYSALTPAFIAIGIIAVFELLGWIARRVGAGQGVRAGLRVRLAFIRARPAVWLLALVVGYAGSPDPVILDVFRDVNVAPPIAVGVGLGLIVAYEGLRLLLSYVRPE